MAHISVNVIITDIGIADDFYCLVGANQQQAEKILSFLEKVNLPKLRAALAKWNTLVNTAGGIEKARQILKTLQD